MARVTGAAGKALEAKALKAETKSAGMIMLFEKGYNAAEVKEVTGAPYGFVYGVGKRAGFIKPTPRAAAKAKAPAKAAAKAPARAAKKAAPAKAKAKAGAKR